MDINLKANKIQYLSEHLKKVAKVAEKIIEKLDLSKEAEEDINKEQLKKIAYYAGLFHDLGKVDPIFQQYMNDKTTTNYNPDGVHIKKIDKKNKFSFENHPRHNEISWFILEELFNKIILKLNKTNFDILKNVVLWHHSAPIRKEEFKSSNIISSINKNKEEFKKNLEFLLDEIGFSDLKEGIDDILSSGNKELSKYKFFYTSNGEREDLESFKKDIKNEAKSSLLRSVLTTADRYVSASGENVNENEIIDNIFGINKYSEIISNIDKMEKRFYPNNEQSKRQKEAALKLAKIKGISILSAAAGAGKTKTALQWAKETNANKIYYIAPRRIICEEIYYELKNNYLKENVSFEMITGDIKLEWNGRKESILEEANYSSDIIITTIDQLVKSITTHKNVSVLFDMIISNVIFDEFHEYYMLSGLNVLFAECIRIKSYLNNSKTLLMSATPNYYMIKNFLELYDSRESESNLVKFETTNEKDFKFSLCEYDEHDAIPADNDLFEPTQDSFKYKINKNFNCKEIEKNPFLKRWPDNKKTMVISNTATMAQISYLLNSNNENSILAHSKYQKEDKIEIFNKIKENFKNINEGVDVLRAGPIIQASLNITSERLVTDLTTPENFLQRLGRLNRFGEDFVGELILAVPYKALNDNIKEKSDVLSLLTKNNIKDSTIKWLNYVIKNLTDNKKSKLFRLEDIYNIYENFYINKDIEDVMEMELIKNLNKSYKNINRNIIDPIEFINSKKKNNSKNKLSKNSLRGQGFYTKMSVYEYNENNNLILTNEYNENINLNRDIILLYDENYKFIKESVKKYELLYKNIDNSIIRLLKKAKKEKSDKYNRIVLNAARDESFNIYTSLSKKDLEKINKEKNDEESIVYIKNKKQAVGYIKLKKIIKEKK